MVAVAGLVASVLARDHISVRVRPLALLVEGGCLSPGGGSTSVVVESMSISSAAGSGAGCCRGDAEISSALRDVVGSVGGSDGGATEDMAGEAVVGVKDWFWRRKGVWGCGKLAT